jgi:hypothetical protein
MGWVGWYKYIIISVSICCIGDMVYCIWDIGMGKLGQGWCGGIVEYFLEKSSGKWKKKMVDILGVWYRVWVMNIHCEWDGDALIIWSGTTLIGHVDDEGESYAVSVSDPVLTITHVDNPSLSFSEIEHIMDNWHNMPKN